MTALEMSCDYVLNLWEFASSGCLEKKITLEKWRKTFFSAFSFSSLPHSKFLLFCFPALCLLPKYLPVFPLPLKQGQALGPLDFWDIFCSGSVMWGPQHLFINLLFTNNSKSHVLEGFLPCLMSTCIIFSLTSVSGIYLRTHF